MVDLKTYEGENLTGQPWQVYPRPQMRRDSFLNLNGSGNFLSIMVIPEPLWCRSARNASFLE